MTTKEKLLKSAITLFVKRSIDNTPTALITKEAGFSEATLFVNFKNKQGIIDAVYLNSKGRQKEAFSKINFTPDNPEQSLTNLYTAGVEYFVTHYDEALFLNQVIDSSHVSKAAKKKLGKESEMFLEVFNLWKKHKKIKDISFDFYDKIIWSAMFDMTKHCRDEGLKEVPKHLESILWDMLKK